MPETDQTEYRVDVICKNEAIDVASIKTKGPLDTLTIKSSAFAIDGARFPFARLEDSVPARCGKCSGLLWFRFASGRLVEAIPGIFKVTG